MSGVVICRQLLAGHAPLLALIPASRMFTGVVPQGTPLPCLAITTVSSTDRNTVAAMPIVKVAERVQITIMGATYPAVKSALLQARKACRNKLGAVGTFLNITCRLDGTGPDFNDIDAGFCMQSQDVFLTYNEAD